MTGALHPVFVTKQILCEILITPPYAAQKVRGDFNILLYFSFEYQSYFFHAAKLHGSRI